MSKLITISPPLAFSPAELSEPEPVRRLIVLVPGAELDYAPIVRRIWKLATALGSRVLFLGLCRDASQGSSLQRQLTTMAALVQDERVTVEARTEFGGDWLDAIQSHYRNGDILVCFSGQCAGRSRTHLSQILEANLAAPVYVLSEPVVEERSGPNWLTQSLAWLGSIGIILAFFWFQTNVAQLAEEWLNTSLALLSIPLEILALLLWNSLLG